MNYSDAGGEGKLTQLQQLSKCLFIVTFHLKSMFYAIIEKKKAFIAKLNLINSDKNKDEDDHKSFYGYNYAYRSDTEDE